MAELSEKHLPGKHDQQDHAHDATGPISSYQRKKLSEVIRLLPKGVMSKIKNIAVHDDASLKDSYDTKSGKVNLSQYSISLQSKFIANRISSLISPKNLNISENVLAADDAEGQGARYGKSITEASMDIVEKRIQKKGNKYCVTSEDGVKNLGCKSTEQGAVERLGQIQYFKQHNKSMTEEMLVASIEAVEAIGGSFNADPVYKSFIGSFIEKHCGMCKEDSPGPDPEVEESGDELAPRKKKHVFIESDKSDVTFVERHLPGRHDQKTHGSGISAGFIPASRNNLTKTFQKVSSKIKELEAKGLKGPFMDEAKKRLEAVRTEAKKIPNVSSRYIQGPGRVNLKLFNGDLRNVLEPLFGPQGNTANGMHEFDYTETEKNGGFKSLTSDELIELKEALEFKHELLVDHEHNEITADDIPIATGIKVDAREAEKVAADKEATANAGGVEEDSQTNSANASSDQPDEAETTQPDVKKALLTRQELIERAKQEEKRTGKTSRQLLNEIYEEQDKALHNLNMAREAFEEIKSGTSEGAKLGWAHRRGGMGPAASVAHTPRQLREAAARQHAKDTGMSVSEARKKVGSGAKVPTTHYRPVGQRAESDSFAKTRKTGALDKFISKYGEKTSRTLHELGGGTEKFGWMHTPSGVANLLNMDLGDKKKSREAVAAYEKIFKKSLIEKAAPDQQCLKALWDEYYKYYSGKWIGAAWGFYGKKQYDQAAQAFEKARDGFQPNKNPTEYNCLEAWRADADGKAGGSGTEETAQETGGDIPTNKHLPGQHDQSTHGHGSNSGIRGKGSSVSEVAKQFGLRETDVDDDIGAVGDYHTFKQFSHSSGDKVTLGQTEKGGDWESTRYNKDDEYVSSGYGADPGDALVDIGLSVSHKSLPAYVTVAYALNTYDLDKKSRAELELHVGEMVETKSLLKRVEKHLPGKHDQQSHGKMGPGPKNLSSPMKVVLNDINSHIKDVLENHSDPELTSEGGPDKFEMKQLGMMNRAREFVAFGDLTSARRAVSKYEESYNVGGNAQSALWPKQYDEYGDDKKNWAPYLNKSLIPQQGVRLTFKSKPLVTEWRITKATVSDDGIMKWEATTTKFDRDVQRDKVTKAFYQEAIRRFKNKEVPPPYFSVAHYKSQNKCECGHEFKSLTDYKCTKCGEDRLLAGITTDMWIQGKQPKAKGIFYPNELGRQMYQEIKSDIQNNIPMDERIRISMGFFPDPSGTIHKSEGRDFISGWIEHHAGTRVPVIPTTDITVEKSMSLNIRTKYEDAEATLNNKALASKLQRADMREKIGKSFDDGLIIKALPAMECPKCHAKLGKDDVDCPECGQLVVKQKADTEDDDEIEEKHFSHTPDHVHVDPEGESVDPESGEHPRKPITQNDVETDLSEGSDAEELEDEPKQDPNNGRSPGRLGRNKGKDVLATESMFDATFGKSLANDPLIQEAAEALAIIQKDLVTPGNNTAEMLARAANLVSSIRDYAHSVAGVVPQVAGAPTAEAAVAVNDLNPAPQPGAQVGGNQQPVPESAVNERPAMDQAQEEAMEDPETDAQESPADEQEEGRLRFAKIPTSQDATNAKQPPKPVESMKARTQPNAVVKSAAKHPAEVFLEKSLVEKLLPILKANMGQMDTLQAIQGTLNEFVPAIKDYVAKSVSQTPADMEEMIDNAVEKAIARRDEQHALEIAKLEVEKTMLSNALANSEIKSIVGRKPIRKSLSAQSVMLAEKSKNIGANEGSLSTPSLNGDQVPFRKFSAGELAKSSTQSNPIHY